ncbi:hypothetical protein H0H87_005655 [Tephrocybe sp. NHM501043]|nr:hypothetical protein H0H87_005655 [Tephrocybe sp. NHM501043]
MVRQRKNQQSDKRLIDPSSEVPDIPEKEQWRLIKESGVLNKLKTIPSEMEDTPVAEEIFNAVIIIIPISFLLLLMEILIHFQYGKHPTLKTLVDRMVSGVPSK